MSFHWLLVAPSVLVFFLAALPAMAYGGDAEPEYILVKGPVAGDPLQTHRYRLSNGLEVFLSVNRETPRFFAEIAVRAGSKNDPGETTGLAHYMEHLLFKGSQRLGTVSYDQEKPHLDRIEQLYEQHRKTNDPEERRKIYAEITRESTIAAAYAVPNEFDQIYRAMGAQEINAHTWHEEVVYKVDLPGNCLENWAIIESDRFAAPVFRLFQTELETVYEEMNRALDNKDRIIQNAVNAALFKNHPYGQQPTLGKVEDLKKPSITLLNQFYETWYRPNNMAIFISGDINIEKTIALISRYFSVWKPAEIPATGTWEEPPLSGREEVRVQYRSEPFVMLAFRTVPVLHEDAEALRMLDMILDNSVAGLINLNLNQKQRVREAGSFPMLMNDYGAQYFYGVPKEGQSLEEVERLLLEQIELIKTGAFDDWLIPAIINDYKKIEKTSLESDAFRVDKMRRAWISYEPWEHAVRSLERMAAVTREDVIRVANTYFGENYVAGFRLDAPHEPLHVEKPPLPEIKIDSTRQSPFAKEIMARPLEPLEPHFLKADEDFRQIRDDAGIVLYHAPNPINDVFTFTVVVDCGTRQDPRMAIAARLLQRTGTNSLSPSDLQIAWYKLGTEFEINVDDNEMSIYLRGLDEQFRPSLALLREMLVNPEIDDASLEELKSIILTQREDARKDPEKIMSALSDYHRYGKDSGWLRMLPADTVRAISAGELQETLRSAMGTRHALLYSGTLSPAEVMDAYNANRVQQGTLVAPPPYTPLVPRVPETTEVYFLNREMAQSHVRLEFGGIPYDPAVSPAAQLYNMYFSGSMSGVVFQELREVRALAYMVGAQYRPGDRKNDPNIMIGVIQTQSDKTSDAVRAFADLLDNLPLSADRYALAREALLNDYRSSRTGFRRIPKVLLDWERRGLQPDPRRRWYEEITAAEGIDLLTNFHKEHIAGRTKLISIVGESARIDLPGLNDTGTVHEIKVEEIFVN